MGNNISRFRWVGWDMERKPDDEMSPMPQCFDESVVIAFKMQQSGPMRRHSGLDGMNNLVDFDATSLEDVVHVGWKEELRRDRGTCGCRSNPRSVRTKFGEVA
jgi:hypothetical protein